MEDEMNKIKAVVFDLDGVYFEGGTERFIKSLKDKFNLTNNEVVQVYLKSEQMQQYKRGEMTSEAFWDYAIHTWGIDSSRDELVAMLMDAYETNPKTVEYVQSLQIKGIKPLFAPITFLTDSITLKTSLT